MTRDGMTPADAQQLLERARVYVRSFDVREDREGWRVELGSDFAADEKLMGTAVGANLAEVGIKSALDHLDAILALILDAKIAHAMAPASLARGALEGTAQTIWMIEPDSQNERIGRTLRLVSAHDSDRRTYLRGVLGEENAGTSTNSGRAKELGDLVGLSRRALRARPKSTEMVTAADAFITARGHDTMMLERWRAASAYAHGRGWPLRMFSAETAAGQDRISHELDSDQLYAWILSAWQAISFSVALFDRRRLPR